MKHLLYFAITILLAIGAQAQTAKVIALSPAESARIQKLFEAKQSAESAWERARSDIEHKYISDSREEPDYGGSLSSSGTTISVVGSGSLATSISYGGTYQPCSVFPGDETTWKDCDKQRRDAAAFQNEQRAKEERARQAELDRIAKLPRRTVYSPKSGWENGFEFSQGFRYIVPKIEIQQATPSRGLGGGCLTTIPVFSAN